MPGPVSQSYDPDPFDPDEWHRQLAANGNRYFVLKIEDVFKYLAPDEIRELDAMLEIICRRREAAGKPRALSYWVYARHWPKAQAIREEMENALGRPIGQPYAIDER
jgi:hypothetical protein